MNDDIAPVHRAANRVRVGDVAVVDLTGLRDLSGLGIAYQPAHTRAFFLSEPFRQSSADESVCAGD
jgi:hypothetical protein